MGSDRRAQRWPAPGQIAVAVVFGLVVAVFIGVLTHHDPGHHDPAHHDAEHEDATRATPLPGATSPTAVTATSGPAATIASGLLSLTIAPQSHVGTYSRAPDFGTWTDVHGCQNTRAALLIRTSQVAVTFTTARDCTVKTGRWIDPWSGTVTTEATGVQIDHTVPLGNAWASGAWAWSHDQRVAFTNDLAETDHLVPILARENEQKGDHGPELWRPPSRSAWCRYALAWDHIKANWRLSASNAEWAALVEMNSTC